MTVQRSNDRQPPDADRPGSAPEPSEDLAVLDDLRMRELMTRFPSGVAVVTAVCADGRPCGMTCTSLASVCLSPPTLLVCLTSVSRTVAAACERGAFAVNLLRAESTHVADRFAAPGIDRFAGVRWRRSPAGLPWLAADSTATADCNVSGALQVGDHTVLLGRLGEVSLRSADPLLYGHRRYSRLPRHENPVTSR